MRGRRIRVEGWVGGPLQGRRREAAAEGRESAALLSLSFPRRCIQQDDISLPHPPSSPRTLKDAYVARVHGHPIERQHHQDHQISQPLERL
jgi:hypothetical protein